MGGVAAAATLVTALVDVGRGRLVGPFGRPFADDLAQLERLLGAVDLPMVVRVDPRHERLVRRARGGRPTLVVPLPRGEVRELPHYAEVQALRRRPDWLGGGPWLPHSPQAALAAYNPVAFAKLSWLAEQARANPFGTPRLFWVDPGLTRAVDPELLRGAGLGRRLGRAAADGFLLTLAPRGGGPTLHGFLFDALRRLAGGPIEHVARAWLFGGRPEAVAAAADLYEQILDETLAEGLMGTEESVLTLLPHRAPELCRPHLLGPDGLEPLVAPVPLPRRRDTLVTAVYDLDPSAPLGGRSRPVAYYLPSLASIAQMGAGLVVYTRPAHVEALEAHFAALGAPAVVIGRDLEEAPRFDRIQELRIAQEFHTKPWRDRCHVLCHTKVPWLAEAAADDPFGSARFYWIDAGLAYPGLMPRRYLGDYLHDRCALFTPRVLDALADEAAELVLVGIQPPEGSQIHHIPLEDHRAWLGPDAAGIGAHVIGGFFGGDRDAVRALGPDYDAVLAAMLAAQRLGTEENVLTALHHRDAGRFELMPFTTWYHEDSDVRRPGPDDVPFYRVFELLAAGRASAVG